MKRRSIAIWICTGIFPVAMTNGCGAGKDAATSDPSSGYDASAFLTKYKATSNPTQFYGVYKWGKFQSTGLEKKDCAGTLVDATRPGLIASPTHLKIGAYNSDESIIARPASETTADSPPIGFALGDFTYFASSSKGFTSRSASSDSTSTPSCSYYVQLSAFSLAGKTLSVEELYFKVGMAGVSDADCDTDNQHAIDAMTAVLDGKGTCLARAVLTAEGL